MNEGGSPYMIHVHCIAHRVALASADAAKVSKTVAEYRWTLDDIYKLYEYSATRYNRLHGLSKVLEDSDFSSLKQPCSVRWLSVGNAVKSAKNNWPALIMEIEEEAATRSKGPAINIQKKIRTYSFIETTYMISDVLYYMDKLITIFQKENFNIGMDMPLVNSTCASLTELITTPGESEKYFTDSLQNGYFRGVKVTYADAGSIRASQNMRKGFTEELFSNLRARCPEESFHVLTCLKVLNPIRLPESKDDIIAYARDSLDVLITQFSPVIGREGNDVTGNVNGDRARKDFSHYKTTVFGLGTTSLETNCHSIIMEYTDVYPDCAVLAKIAMTIPVSSVAAERGFSLQNLIHNRLSQDRLNTLMALNMHAGEKNIEKASAIFRNKNRKL